MHAYAQKQMQAGAEPVLRKRERESSGLEDALNLRPDVQAEMRVAQMFAGNAPVQRVIAGVNEIRALAEEEGVLAIVNRQIASDGATFAWIWLKAGIDGINLTRPIQNMAAVWDAVPALGFADIVALDGVHNGIAAAGLAQLAGNVPAGRTLQNMIDLANGAAALNVVQLLALGAVRNTIDVNGLIAMASNIPAHRTLQNMIDLATNAAALTAAQVVALAGIHNGIDIAGVTQIAQNLGARTAADVVRFANNLTGLTAVQVVQMLGTYPAVAVDNIVAAAVTGVWTPRDNFAGRSANNAGVGEVVDLSVTIVPAGITAADLGGLQWAITGGPGAIGGANLNLGTATYTAQGAGNVTLAARVAAGGYAGTGTGTLNKATVAPTGVNIVVVAIDDRSGPPASHVQFTGQPYYLPTNVSFYRTEVREREVNAVANGYFAAQNGLLHEAGEFTAVGGGNIGTGSPDSATDSIGTNVCRAPYVNGTFTWSIPWEYRAPGVNATIFTTLQHVKQIDGAGRLTLSKGGASVSSA